jgi:RimJ/RimL family protein N-acetyltransferase
MLQPPSIRLLTGADAPAYQALRIAALQQNPESFLATHEVESHRPPEFFTRELDYANHLPMYGYYGIFLDQTLVGYIQVDGVNLPKQRHIAFLYNLYISHDHRRKGLAATLCKHVLRELENQTNVELVFGACAAKNKSALAFYHQFGFRRCGIKPRAIKWQDEYDDEVDLVLELAAQKQS